MARRLGTKHLVLLLVLGFLSPISWATAEDPIAIEGATILDGNGGPPLPDGIIVIESGRIAAVGLARPPRCLLPPTASMGVGSSSTPGFIDTNVHLSLYGGHTNERYETLVRYHDRQEDVGPGISSAPPRSRRHHRSRQLRSASSSRCGTRRHPGRSARGVAHIGGRQHRGVGRSLFHLLQPYSPGRFDSLSGADERVGQPGSG